MSQQLQSSHKLPSLEEFFIAHGASIKAPRIVLPYHKEIFRRVTQWVTGTLPDGKRNLAICIPPRHSKTFIARDAVAWGLGCVPDSEFIYTSYSSTLAVNQTVSIKNTCSSDWYQRIFPYVGIEAGKGRQDYFGTACGGSVYGVGVGGSITGFGAGKKRKEFGGGIIIDDPLPALQATSIALRESCNWWYTQALLSRKNHDETPTMLIMQRLHELDLVGYVLQEEAHLWHLHSVPVVNENNEMLWPETFSHASMEDLKRNNPFAFNSQYMQSPTPLGGAMIKEAWLQRYHYENLPKLTKYGIFVDTAQKAKQANDYSVFLLAGTDGINVYLMDIVRGKFPMPELVKKSKEFWAKHRPNRISNPTPFIGAIVEDKISGTSLIQTLQVESDMPVIAKGRSIDKVSRVNGILSYIYAGKLYIPYHVPWASDCVSELTSFSPAMTHLHDDQVDVITDAIEELLIQSGGIFNQADWG